MRSFTDIFIKHPVPGGRRESRDRSRGVAGADDLPLQQYPKIESSSVIITTVYYGASAETVRGFLSTPIERVVSAIGGVDYVESTSRAGVSTVTVHLKLNHSSTAALAEVTARLQQVRSELPAEAEPPTIEVQRADRPIRVILSQLHLHGAQRAGRHRLAVAHAAAPTLDVARCPAGHLRGRPPDRHAHLDRSRPPRILQPLARRRPERRCGAIITWQRSGEQRRTSSDQLAREYRPSLRRRVRRTDRRRPEAGPSCGLKDVAKVEREAEEADMVAKYNEKEGVYLGIWALIGSNEIEVAHRLRDEMERIRPTLPKDIDMQLVWDGTMFMRNALTEISKTLSETILIVALVVFLFMGSVRTALVPLVAMPVSLIGAAIFMFAFGFSLNLLTLLAIVLSVGLVVDDAIVVVENVERHVRLGKSRIEAALIGARELIGPIIAMTITLATVYAPIGFQGGLDRLAVLGVCDYACRGSGVIGDRRHDALAGHELAVRASAREEGRLTAFVNRRFEEVRRVYAWLLDGALEPCVGESWRRHC